MLIKRIQAHRGYSDVFPENTMLAFREAVKAGAGGIEMDVHKTADGEFVLMHDPSVDRTTNGTGPIKQLTYKEDLITLDSGCWRGSEFADRNDTRIATLQQALEEFKQSDVVMVLHVKQLQIEDCLAILHQIETLSMLEQVVFFGRPEVINMVKRAQPLVFTQNDGAPGPDSYEQVLLNAIEYGHPAVSVSAENVTQMMVDHIKRYNKLVHCSFLSTNYEESMKRLMDLGVDFVLGNDASRMVKALNNCRN